VEHPEVAEIKRTVFRALTRLRAARIIEFDTIARLETQAIEETQGGNTEEEIAEEKDNLNTLYIRDPDHEQSGDEFQQSLLSVKKTPQRKCCQNPGHIGGCGGAPQGCRNQAHSLPSVDATSCGYDQGIRYHRALGNAGHRGDTGLAARKDQVTWMANEGR